MDDPQYIQQFSWYTFIAVIAYFIMLALMIRYMKNSHPSLYDDAGKNIWSFSSGIKLATFLFTFRYFALQDNQLTFLAIGTKVFLLIGGYLIFTQPIFFLVAWQ